MSSDKNKKDNYLPKFSLEEARQKRKDQQKIWHHRYVRVFTYLFASLLAISILLIPIRPQKSDLEKRELAAFPRISFSGIMAGSWFDDISIWFSDTFPFREQLLSCQSVIEKLYGLKGEELYGSTRQGDEIPESSELAPSLSTKSNETDGTITTPGEVAGTVYVADNRGFEIYYFSNSSAIYYASMLNTVHAILGDSVTIYDMLVPSSFAVCLDEKTQASLGGSNTREAINYTYSMLDPAIVQVSVMDTLVKHNAEYIYFNTDHHWTQLGAYYAYQEFCNVRGFTAHNLSEFKESKYPNFLGTFYSSSYQSEALASNPDTLYTYTPNGTNECIISDEEDYDYTYPVVDDASEYSTGGKYSAFIGGDHPLTTINNPAITDGSSCVVIKESYGNAFVPFLVDHYQTVYVVDYRYYSDNLTSFILQNNVSDVIFLNISDAILQSNAENMLRLFQ